MATMRAVVFDGQGRSGLRDVPRPEVRRDDDVVLRVDACGICGTDVRVLAVPPQHHANPGTILGHEIAATIVEAGDALGDFSPGDRVVFDPDIPCLRCAYCARGLTGSCLNLQETGASKDGGFAEYILVPARTLFHVPAEMSLEEAALIEPLACAMTAADRAHIQPGDAVVVLGGGPIGLLFLQIYRAAGARQVLVVEPVAARAESARELGAAAVLDPHADVAARVRELTGIGADVVVDAMGSGMAAGLPLLRRGGTLLLFGINEQVRAEIPQARLTMNNLRIVGSAAGSGHFPAALNFMSSGAVQHNLLVTHQFPLDQFDAALETLRSGQALKVLIRPHD
jgi:2-desacetyl-2-hydroxyethyl bacteriochlorophyllide A dehydrogenase